MADDAPAFPIRRILACVAEGTTSDHAVGAAADVARRSGAELELLHVVEPILTPGSHFGTLSSEELSRGRADRAKEQILAHLSHRHPPLGADDARLASLLQVAVGSPARVVLEHLHDHGDDVVFVGESGKRKQLDFGGLARALFARAPCAVWMQVEPPRPFERLLVPIDLSPSSRRVLSCAVDLARTFDAHVTALTCFVPPELFPPPDAPVTGQTLPYTLDAMRKAERDAFTEFVEGFDWRGVRHGAEFVDDDPARAILASQDRFELIVMGTHGRSALAAALLGSVTWQVLRLTRTAVLTIRDAQQKFAF